MKYLEKYFSTFSNVVQVAFIILTLLTTVNIVVYGNFAFWYDPARDLLQAWDSHTNLSLIGPTSGIPGVFYGPYWIWFISIVLLFTQDPRFVVTFVITIPMILACIWLILGPFRRTVGISLTLSTLVLFLASNFIGYATNLWNPNLAVPLFLVLFSLLLWVEKKSLSWWLCLLIGLLVGMIANVHLSFGLGVLLATGLFVLIREALFLTKPINWIQLRHWLLQLVAFGVGLLLISIPTMVFELRHDFLQTRQFLSAISQSVVYQQAVVSQQNTDSSFVINSFLNLPISLFHVSRPFVLMLVFVLAVILLWRMRRIQTWLKWKRIQISLQNSTTILFLVLVIVSCLGLYLTTKNPVWNYHFIGLDAVTILLIILLISRSRTARIIMLGWILVVMVGRLPELRIKLSELGEVHQFISSLAIKSEVIDWIKRDAGSTEYQIYAYNPAIFPYDFQYLARWRDSAPVLYKPAEIQLDTVYIIFPEVSLPIREDFIHYVTHPNVYRTEVEVPMKDKMSVVKRVRLSKVLTP